MSEIVAALDTETTGFVAPDHRIIEVYVELVRGDRSIFTYEQRIDPLRSIPIEAQRVHGITASDLIGKPKWEAVGPIVHKILTKADRYLIHNAEFDMDFLKQEFKRIGLDLPDRPHTCTMEEGIWATPDGKKPRLQELCFACGIAYDPTLAHAAAYDVKRMIDCWLQAKKWGYYASENAVETVQAA